MHVHHGPVSVMHTSLAPGTGIYLVWYCPGAGISLKPTAGLVGTGGRRRAREKCREGQRQRGDCHSAKDPRNGLEIF
jgi:hypothetical protein